MATKKFSLRCRGVVFVCQLRDCSRLVGEICFSFASATLAVALRCVLPDRLDFVLEFALSFLLTFSIGCVIIFPCLHVDWFHFIKTTRNRKGSGNHLGDRSVSWVYGGPNSDGPTGRTTAAANEIETNTVYMTVKDEERHGSAEYVEIYGSTVAYHSLARAGPSTSWRTFTTSGTSRPPSQNFEDDGDLPSGPGEPRTEVAPSTSGA